MKRSELNKIIREAIGFAEGNGIKFPPFAKWGVEDWKKVGEQERELVDNMLGWDVTDFGSGDFRKCELLIFTFRNGNFHDKETYPKPYAEKLLLVDDGQELPYHFHWSKIEDIINRGGGNLIVQLYNADENEGFASTDVTVTVDGQKRKVPAGGTITLESGQSITLLPGQYHRWEGEKGTGKVMLFEVSTTNDDTTDNRFYEAKERIPNIVQDEEPQYLIFDDYKEYVTLN